MPESMSIGEAAIVIGVSADTLRRWDRVGQVQSYRTERGHRRLQAEQAWLSQGLPLHIFRLAGIYGPGRNQLLTVANGTAKRVVKPGQVFSRIHVADIAGVVQASINQPNPGRAYNVCDDEPCPPQDVVAYAAELLNMPAPPEIPACRMSSFIGVPLSV